MAMCLFLCRIVNVFTMPNKRTETGTHLTHGLKKSFSLLKLQVLFCFLQCILQWLSPPPQAKKIWNKHFACLFLRYERPFTLSWWPAVLFSVNSGRVTDGAGTLQNVISCQTQRDSGRVFSPPASPSSRAYFPPSNLIYQRSLTENKKDCPSHFTGQLQWLQWEGVHQGPKEPTCPFTQNPLIINTKCCRVFLIFNKSYSYTFNWKTSRYILIIFK